MAWKATREKNQAPQGTKAKSRPNQVLVSQSVISKPRSIASGAPKTAQSSAQNAEKESNVPEDCIPINMLTRPKHKKNRKKNSFEHIAKKYKMRNVESTQEKTSKRIRLYLLNNANPEAQVNPEDVKKISKKESILRAPSLELRMVLEILQKSDPFAQKKSSQAVWHAKLAEERQ